MHVAARATALAALTPTAPTASSLGMPRPQASAKCASPEQCGSQKCSLESCELKTSGWRGCDLLECRLHGTPYVR